MDKKDKRKKILKVTGLIGLFLLVFGLSYALFTVTLNGTKKVKVKTGKLELQLLDENDLDITKQENAGYSISLDNQVPISDEDGLSQEGFTFKLKNNGTIDAKYEIYLDDVALEQGEERLLDTYVKYSLTKNNTEGTPALLSTTLVGSERELDKGIIKTSEINTYTLKVWIDEEANTEAMDKVFNTTLRVEGSQYVKKDGFEEGTAAATLYNKGITEEYDTTTQKIPNGFNSETEEEGLIKYTDNEGTVTYAYRGLDPDNYVSFAEQTWRILRIQEDGTIKLIRQDAVNYENSTYDSGSETSSGVTYRKVQYNKTYSSDDDNKYSTSNIKSYVEAWYDATMTSYDNKIVMNEYCSDRTEDHNSPFYQMIGSRFTTMYGVYNRVDLGGWDGSGQPDSSTFSWTPNVSCTTEKINTKAALITADEYVLAGGGLLGDEINNYLKKSYYYWAMSPTGFQGDYAKSYRVDSYGDINGSDVDNDNGVVPVITLKADVAISSGVGTSEHPYVIS